VERNAFAFATGLFVLVFGLGILVTSRWLAGPEAMSRPYLVVTESSVAGLSPFSKVYFRGVEVGQVTDIDFATDGSRDIVIRIALQRPVPVTVNTYAVLKSQGLTGLAFIELLDDGPTDAPQLPTGETEPARIVMRPSLLESFQAVGQGIAEQIQRLVGNINKLLTPENSARLVSIIENIESLTGHLDALVRASQPAIARLEPLARSSEDAFGQASLTLKTFDDTLKILEARLTQAEALIGKSEAVVGQSQTTLNEFGAQVNDRVLPELENALGAVSAAARRIEQLTRSLEQNPPALLRGQTSPRPGPGESGYQGG